MKKYIPLLFFILLESCGSYQYEYFRNSFAMPSQDIQAGYRIEATSSDFHIPFVICRSFRGKPYFLNINFFCENLPEKKIFLTKVLFTNTLGNEFKLLKKSVEIVSFEHQRFAASSSQYGNYDNMIYKAEWRSEKLPLTFQNGKSCKIEIKYVIGNEQYSKKWKASTNLQKKTTNIITFYKLI